MRKTILSLCLFAVTAKLWPQQQQEFSRDSLLATFDEGIRYLHNTQLRNNEVSGPYTGEWPSYIENTAFIPFLGKQGKTAYDSNCFITLFIHNSLAEFYLRFRPSETILNLLSLARLNAALYRNEAAFNFWPLLPRPSHLRRCRHNDCSQRRPVNFKYHYGFVNNYANVFDDADDSAAGLLAGHYMGLTGDTSNSASVANGSLIASQIEKYRDTGQRKSNWYNKQLGFGKRTGAYLTWFGPDRKHSNFFSWFFTSHTKQQILYGRNEVDCVVNANVIRSLHVAGYTPSALHECREFIRQVINSDLCFTCGVYYPTEFVFHYSVARCISDGVPGFDEFREPILKQVLGNINKDGYWSSELPGNDLQATLYALNTLLLLDKEKKHHTVARTAMRYVMGQGARDGNGIHWPAGVFFSGGSAIRYAHVWRSEAYSTCLALEVLHNYIEQPEAN